MRILILDAYSCKWGGGGLRLGIENYAMVIFLNIHCLNIFIPVFAFLFGSNKLNRFFLLWLNFCSFWVFGVLFVLVLAWFAIKLQVSPSSPPPSFRSILRTARSVLSLTRWLSGPSAGVHDPAPPICFSPLRRRQANHLDAHTFYLHSIARSTRHGQPTREPTQMPVAEEACARARGRPQGPLRRVRGRIRRPSGL